MSRVGKIPVAIPQGVKAQVSGSTVKIEGPKGKLERQLSPGIKAEVADGKIAIVRSSDEKQQRMLQGLERALVNNMVVGVSEGYAKDLDLIGVGYRADIKGQVLTLGLGYSHTIDFELPAGIKGSVIKEGRDITVRVEGIDRQLVGQVAANIRSLREPEPYKGKGVRYKGEVIKLKAGKAGKK